MFIVLPAYTVSQEAKRIFGRIWRYLSRIPEVPMSVAVLENTAPMEAVARAITTPVTEFVMMATRNEYNSL